MNLFKVVKSQRPNTWTIYLLANLGGVHDSSFVLLRAFERLPSINCGSLSALDVSIPVTLASLPKLTNASLM